MTSQEPVASISASSAEISETRANRQSPLARLRMSWEGLTRLSLAKPDDKLAAVLSAATGAIIALDRNARVDLCNGAAEAMFGYAATQLSGKSIAQLLREPYASQLIANLSLFLETGERGLISGSRDILAVHADGGTFPMELSIGVTAIGGEPLFAITCRDITQRQRAQEELRRYREELERLVLERTTELLEANAKLERLARTDGLTGIANRRFFNEVLEREVRRAHQEQIPLSLVLCDIDHFKEFNDTYGHIMGDVCLQRVGQVIRHCAQRVGGIAARYGGEEFAVILPSIDMAGAQAEADELRKGVIELRVQHRGSPVADVVTMSVGCVTAPPGCAFEAEGLLRAADRALYRAKHRGRDRTEPGGLYFPT